MGLGKTLQAIAIAAYYKCVHLARVINEYRDDWPLLVIAPSSLCLQWTQEIKKWVDEALLDCSFIRSLDRLFNT